MRVFFYLRFFPFLILQLVVACASASDFQTVLCDNGEIIAERTEVRFAVPPGCVVTGIGARAHYDNITTLWVVYRRLRKDGALGPSREVHTGSEPEHRCEALVRLPDSYVACGFGARGAPEWDITTLWVWARPLLPGGSLGEVRIFKAGFKPEHEGLERKAVDLRPGRVLTGVGLRFASNDVAGIWASSARILRVGRKGLRVAGALFEAPGEKIAEAVRVFQSFFPRGEVWSGEGSSGFEPARSGAGGRVRKPVVLSAEVGFTFSRRVNPLLEEAAAGEAEENLPERSSLSVAVDIEPAKGVPWFRAERVTYLFLLAREAELPVVLKFQSGRSLTDSPALGEYFLRLASALTASSLPSLSQVLGSFSESRFGNRHLDCVPVLLKIEDLCPRVLTLEGIPLWLEGKPATFSEIEKLSNDPAFRLRFPDRAEWWSETEAPTESLIRDVSNRKRFALIQVEEIAARLEEASSKERGDRRSNLGALADEMKRLKSIGEVTTELAETFLSLRLFARNGDPEAKKKLEEKIASLGEKIRSLGIGNPEPVTDSFRKALLEAECSNPTVRALERVERLLREGKGEKAASALREILEDPLLSRFVLKHRPRLSRLLSSLPVLWDGPAQGKVKIMWGGDGRFSLVERAGKWGIMTTKRGPTAYFGWRRMEKPAVIKLSFSYLDLPGQTIYVHYNGDFAGGLSQREYHPVKAIETEGTGKWRSVAVLLPRAFFQGRQNEGADFRIIGSKSGIVIRNVRVIGPALPSPERGRKDRTSQGGS